MTRIMKSNLLYSCGDSGWCKHGLVLTFDNGHGLEAADTYWGNGYPSGTVDIAELEAKGTFMADLDEFRASDRNEHERFAEADRVFIPLGGRSERYLVRKSAKPDPVNAVAQIKWELQEWESKRRSAEWHIAELKKELSTYES